MTKRIPTIGGREEALLNALQLAEATILRLQRHAPGSAEGTLAVIVKALQPYRKET